jgi:hypothetical protein
VVLTLSREDYQKLMMALGFATSAFLARPGELEGILMLMNRLNAGNPHYTPYRVEKL